MAKWKQYVVVGIAASLSLLGCIADKNKVYDNFQEVNADKWSWHDAKSFTFTITEKNYAYDLICGLRITGSYNYSNIYLIYTLESKGVKMKELFQIQLSDKTGKWLGKGMSNLITYEQMMKQSLKLEPGVYTVKISQNMQDEEIQAVSDIGLKVIKSSKIY